MHTNGGEGGGNREEEGLGGRKMPPEKNAWCGISPKKKPRYFYFYLYLLWSSRPCTNYKQENQNLCQVTLFNFGETVFESSNEARGGGEKEESGLRPAIEKRKRSKQTR